MMYSDADIRRVIESGELVIDPFQPELIRPAGVSLRLGETLLRPRAGTVVDVLKGIAPQYDELKLTEDDPFILQPQEFTLAHTYEKVSVGASLGFFIEGRSTLARIGLTIVQTAMLVYPGHERRTVTLELANHGPNPIVLYPLMKIARAAIFELKTPANTNYDKDGKYREQVTVGPPIFRNEVFKD